jgi:dipeptidyl aminopeptidase/acylaminoacyl peptidase
MLYVRGRAAGANTSGLLRIDMRKGTLEAQTVLALDGYDFSGGLIRNGQGKVLGVNFLTDARGTHWFDTGIAQSQKQVDALLPGLNNQLDCGECESPARVLVRSSSDRQPTVFRLFDAKAGTLSDLAASRPWIQPAAMAMRDMVRITARDGLSIPVHLTRPSGLKGVAPMVVLVHGGPWVRGAEWAWHGDSQFLASRGYVVIEPEFRGSTGFGDKLFRAGFKQWGLAMQDDIADATLWAIKQGYADSKRVCIAGASYGGYATLMGLIRYPELYRCGFEWVGVTDIDLMYSIQWSDSSENWKGYGMPVLVGDRVKDAAQLATTSPLKLASRLMQPLLMAYGGEDRRVPIEHGLKMRDALRGHNKDVEWIDYPSEGHGWMLQANDIDFWTRVEKFLDRNLKNAP